MRTAATSARARDVSAPPAAPLALQGGVDGGSWRVRGFWNWESSFLRCSDGANAAAVVAQPTSQAALFGREIRGGGRPRPHDRSRCGVRAAGPVQARHARAAGRLDTSRPVVCRAC
ncbi:hypothetical protein PAHAL_1G250500 [Panicum hallii]|uniref:Uncharacterized protein n=1 Tax=Panicum hallii TaxID=206008 RepID=A0A2T8KWE0_9POAL|nr:hypothetical protein PAHAL_1G250500 [Panicum hallii]